MGGKKRTGIKHFAKKCKCSKHWPIGHNRGSQQVASEPETSPRPMFLVSGNHNFLGQEKKIFPVAVESL